MRMLETERSDHVHLTSVMTPICPALFPDLIPIKSNASAQFTELYTLLSYVHQGKRAIERPRQDDLG